MAAIWYVWHQEALWQNDCQRGGWTPISALGKPCLVHQKARGSRVWPLPVDEHLDHS